MDGYGRNWLDLTLSCSWRCVYAGCTPESRNKLCPMFTATGPNGHVIDCTLDLDFKAARRCTYIHDVLIQECVTPLDVAVPYWGFNDKFVMVYTFNSVSDRGNRRTSAEVREAVAH